MVVSAVTGALSGASASGIRISVTRSNKQSHTSAYNTRDAIRAALPRSRPPDSTGLDATAESDNPATDQAETASQRLQQQN